MSNSNDHDLADKQAIRDLQSAYSYAIDSGAYDKLDFDIVPQFRSRANIEVMQTSFSFLHCPSDNYRGLTTNWGGQRARILHYYAVNGSNEGSNLA